MPFERLILLIARRAPGWAVVGLVVLLYGGIGLALPIALNASTVTSVGLNVLGAMLAMSVVLAWFLGLVEARDRRHLVEWTTDLRLLDSQEFEWFVGELYRRQGWAVEQTGRRDGPDGGVDLQLRRGDGRRLVQCKRWASWPVGVEDVRAFAGALLREGLSGPDGIFAALSGFTQQAADEAARVGIELLDGRDPYRAAEADGVVEGCRLGSAVPADRVPRPPADAPPGPSNSRAATVTTSPRRSMSPPPTAMTRVVARPRPG